MATESNIFAGLDAREIDYVQARANAKTDREALLNASLSQGWFRNKDKADLNRRAMEFKTDNILKAQIILDQAVEEAAKVKAAGLLSRNERIKQDSATEILDRRLGKPTQNIDQKTEQSGEININIHEIDKQTDDEQD